MKTWRNLTAVALLLGMAATPCLAAPEGSEGGSGGPGSGQSVTATQLGHQQTNTPAPGVVAPGPAGQQYGPNGQRYGQVGGNPGYANPGYTETTPVPPTPDAKHPNTMPPSGGGR